MIEELGRLIAQVANEPIIQAPTLIQSARALFNWTIGIKGKSFLDKLESFFTDLKFSIITQEGIDKFSTMLKKQNKSAEEIYSLIIIVIDRLDRHYKAEYVAKLLTALWSGNIRYDQFDDMLKIIEDWFDSDMETLRIHKDIETMDVSEYLNTKIDIARRNRLVSMGVISKKIKPPGFVAVSERVVDYALTVYGEILLQLFTRHISTVLDDFSEITTIFGDSVSNIGFSCEVELKKSFPNAKLGDSAYVQNTESRWYWSPFISPPTWVNSNIEEKYYLNLSAEEKEYIPYLVRPNKKDGDK